MRALVTGAAGFIGSHITQNLLKKDYEVIGLDNLDPYYSLELKEKNIQKIKETNEENFRFIKEDIRDFDTLEEVFGDFSPRVVFHEAAQAGVRKSVQDPRKPNAVNVNGTLNLLELCRKNDVDKFINASSSSVYGEKEYLPMDESHPKEPRSPYGVSKLAAEKYTKLYHDLYGLDSISFRYFTVYGKRMRPNMAISNFTKKCLKNESPVIYGDGEQSRDFTHIEDVVRANLLVLEKFKLSGEAINIGSGINLKIKELAQKIKELTNNPKELVFDEEKKGDARHTYAAIKKAKKVLDYEPKKGLEKGLKEFIDWLSNENNLRFY